MAELVFTQAKSFVCSWCRRAWPPVEEFAVCPCCREETVANKTVPQYSYDEARAEAIRFEFGWYLWETNQL